MTALASSSPISHICYDTPAAQAEAQKQATLSGPGSGSNEFGSDQLARETAFGIISVSPKNGPDSIENSYLKIQKTMVGRAQLFGQKFEKHIVAYIKDWDDAVSTRISALMKEHERRRLDLEHYTRKVEGMRLTVNKAMASGKKVPADAADKLQRNEIKLKQSRESFEKYTHDFYLIVNEVTDRAWKDLHPILVKMLQFDMTLAQEEAKLYSSLRETIEALKAIGTANDLDANGRLTAIRTLQAEYLFTGDRTQLFQNRLMLENGPTRTNSAPSFANMDDKTNWAQQEDIGDTWRAQSFSNGGLSSSYYDLSSPSGSDHPGSLEMLGFAASSAPPPTLDDLTAATSEISFGRSGPSSAPSSSQFDPFASQPVPLNTPKPSNQWNPAATPSPSWQQSQPYAQFNGGGVYGSSPAPAPMAAPPPPPQNASPAYPGYSFTGPSAGGYNPFGVGLSPMSAGPSPMNSSQTPFQQYPPQMQQQAPQVQQAQPTWRHSGSNPFDD